MTINDMINAGIDLQGKAEIKHWNEEKETYDRTVEFDEGAIYKTAYSNDKDLFDMEITHIYSQNNILTFEVKEQD